MSELYGYLSLVQALLDDREALEKEKGSLLASQASLQSQVQQLQVTQGQLQQALQESHSELEQLQRGVYACIVEVKKPFINTLAEKSLTIELFVVI